MQALADYAAVAEPHFVYASVPVRRQPVPDAVDEEDSDARERQKTLSRHLFDQLWWYCRKQNIAPDQLTLHADRGASMTSKPVALLLADLGVTKTHSRPHVSDDNPFSESQFKTLKYRPVFPERFGSIQDARAFCQVFFPWYNTEHHHSGIGLLTPEVLHYGRADQVIAQRQVTLTQAFQRNPERFVRAHPQPPARPTAVWINPPPVPAASEREQH